jgi:hypothetical protein
MGGPEARFLVVVLDLALRPRDTGDMRPMVEEPGHLDGLTSAVPVQLIAVGARRSRFGQAPESQSGSGEPPRLEVRPGVRRGKAGMRRGEGRGVPN